MLDGNYNEIEFWIANDKVDFGFVSLPTVKNFETIPLKKDPLLCILPKSHRLHKRRSISLTDIKDDPFIMPKWGRDDDIERIFAAAKVKIAVKFEVTEAQAIIAMVKKGLGVSILRKWFCRANLTNSSRPHRARPLPHDRNCRPFNKKTLHRQQKNLWIASDPGCKNIFKRCRMLCWLPQQSILYIYPLYPPAQLPLPASRPPAPTPRRTNAGPAFFLYTAEARCPNFPSISRQAAATQTSRLYAENSWSRKAFSALRARKDFAQPPLRQCGNRLPFQLRKRRRDIANAKIAATLIREMANAFRRPNLINALPTPG